MPRLPAIEGLRAWLAWVVVLCHIGQSIGIGMRGGHWVWIARGGQTAVLVFIAISGFVICGLLVDKREGWRRYIVRRAFRLFPAYLVAYAIALAVFPVGLAGINYMSWKDDANFQWDDVLAGWEQAMADHPIAQLLLHAALLQGVVPDSIWPLTSSAVLSPAWSLSLEWQFYLLAPAVVWLLVQRSTRLLTVAVILAAAIAFKKNAFGEYSLPSFLPAAGYIFLVGIGCRLAFPSLKGAPLALELPVVAFGFGILFPELLWLAVWVALFAFLLSADVWRDRDAMRPLWRVMSAALESRLAVYLGARSYSVYLIHLPIIQIMIWLLAPRIELTQLGLFFALIVTVVPVTMIVSNVLYRVVERPMIELGARLARRPTLPEACT